MHVDAEKEEERKERALIWLNDNEYSGSLPCGCELSFIDGDPAFIPCEKHKKIYEEN